MIAVLSAVCIGVAPVFKPQPLAHQLIMSIGTSNDSWLRLDRKVIRLTSWHELTAMIPVLIIWYSVWQGSYNFDPHYWGWMFNNANDLLAGKQPYWDIVIQYGFLTTLIHSLDLTLLGKGCSKNRQLKYAKANVMII
jgi:hypothetical protein